jgi:Cys-rich repeat protein
MYCKKEGFIVVLIVLFLISLSNVNAQTNTSFDASKGFEWLYSKMEKNDWNYPVDALAFSILALRNEGYNISRGVEKLKAKERNNNWGGVSSSALATLALYKVMENVSDEVEWLLDQQVTALKDGNWLIQFLVTDTEGQCKVSYGGDTFEFIINGTSVQSEDCYLSDSRWVDFEECIKQGEADLTESMDILCFLGGVRPSILFRTYNNEYYIVDESAPFVIENGCFGTGFECSCVDSGFASLALNLMDEHPFTGPYLRSQCRGSPVELAFLYLVSGEGIEELVNMQNDDGSFEGDEFKTAIAYLALKRGSGAAASQAYDWLKFKQRSDGSWRGDVLTTAVVLFSAFSQELPPAPVPVPPPEEEVECEVDDDCGIGEECRNNVCVPPSQIHCGAVDECVVDSDCSVYGRGYVCTTECKCEQRELEPGKCYSDSDCGLDEMCDLSVSDTGPGICVTREEEVECRKDSDCPSGEVCNVAYGLCVSEEGEGGGGPSTEEKKSALLTWLIVILVVIVGLVGGYIVYNKFFKGKFGKKPEQFRPPTMPSRPSYPVTRQKVPVRRPVMTSRPARSSVETELEKQLDESLRKARELLKKK